MKYYRIIALLIIILTVNAFTQIPFFLNNEFESKHVCNDFELCSHLKSKLNELKFNEKLQAVNQRPYNVLTYDVYLDWQKPLSGPDSIIADYGYSGTQNMSLEITESDIDSISLDAGYLKINSIYLDNIKINQDIQPINSILTIPLDKKYNKNDKLYIKIDYEYNSQFNLGFFLFPKGKIPWGKIILENLHRIAYTFSEPEFARFWMPCNDVPDDKAISSIAVKVPEGYLAGSNGLLDSTISGENSLGKFNIFYWSENNPIPPYLMLAFASEFQIMKDFYIRITEPHDSIPILNYFWSEDYNTEGSIFNAKNSLKVTPEIISAFSKLFGEFPFRKYGHGVLQPFGYGGMEHQTLTTINRDWLKGWSESGIAHEISHQWLGDLVTCKTWQDIWFNEGGASWAEALWEKEKADKINPGNGGKAYNDLLLQRVGSYLNYPELYNIPIYGVTTPNIFVYTGITYTKASWIFNMLYKQIEMLDSKEPFLDFIRNLFNKYRFGNVSTAIFHNELKSYLETNKIDFDIDLFFEQWVYGSGHPIFKISLELQDVNGNNYGYKIKYEQVQGQFGMRDFFICPVKFKFFKNGIVNAVEEWDYRYKVDSVYFMLGFKPDSVALDRSELLCNVLSSVVDVKESLTTQNTNIYPNPANDFIIVENSNDFIIKIYNFIGELVLTSEQNPASFHRLNINTLAPGIYFIKIGNRFEMFVKI
jgi:aminopeptidase N